MDAKTQSAGRDGVENVRLWQKARARWAWSVREITGVGELRSGERLWFCCPLIRAIRQTTQQWRSRKIKLLNCQRSQVEITDAKLKRWRWR